MAKTKGATDYERQATAEAKELLEGRTIKTVRYMTRTEAAAMGWERRPLRIELDDGTTLFASCDEEGNDAGALFGVVDGVGDICLGRF